MSPARLVRVRWAVRGALALGVAASVAANVLHARPNPVSQTIAAWPPLALLLTVELISRVPVHHRYLAAVRLLATAAISAIAAYVSYWHMAGVAVRYGEAGASAYLLPLSVDGLVVVASVSLVELAGQLRHTAQAPDRPVSTVDVPVPPVAADRTGTPPADPAPVPTQRVNGHADPGGPPRPAAAATDDELLRVLRGVARDPDGTVPVRRAARELGCGPDRARRLLDAEGLRTPAVHPGRRPALAT